LKDAALLETVGTKGGVEEKDYFAVEKKKRQAPAGKKMAPKKERSVRSERGDLGDSKGDLSARAEEKKGTGRIVRKNTRRGINTYDALKRRGNH